MYFIIFYIIILFLISLLLIRFTTFEQYYHHKFLHYDLYKLLHQPQLQHYPLHEHIQGGSLLSQFSLWESERKVNLTYLDDSDIDLTLPQVEEEVEYISKNWNQFEKNYGKIIAIIHPFDRIKNPITMSSSLTKDSTFHPTNAFMKMYEAFLLLKENGWYDKQKTINQFDVAAAPGMFVVGGEKFTQKYKKKFELVTYQKMIMLISKISLEYLQSIQKNLLMPTYYQKKILMIN